MPIISRRRRLGTGGAPSNQNPSQPTVSAGTLTSTGATFTGSVFSDPDVGDTHAASQWRVTRTSDSVVLYNPGDDAVNKTSLVWSGGASATAYTVELRYKDNNGNYSAWSSATPFTTTSGVTTYLSDAFSTTKAGLNGTNTDTGQTWTTVGTFTTDSTNAICAAGNANARADAGHSDGVVRWTIAQGADGAAGLFRYTDTLNFWYLGFSAGTPNRLYLGKLVAGSPSPFVTRILNVADGDVVSVTLSGNNITFRNETQGTTDPLGTLTDSFNATATIIGLKTEAGMTGTAKWGDISMKSA